MCVLNMDSGSQDTNTSGPVGRLSRNFGRYHLPDRDFSMDNITIYHNPRCSKSRQTLALIRDRGTEPQIIHYLDTPPSPD